jgi:dihydroorotate dehydrogenase (fumarate)
MPDLKTTWLGLELKSPVIVASSGLSKSADDVKACEDAGAGAVVLKSLFEEVLAQQDYEIEGSTGYHTEAYDYLRSELELQYGPREYCRTIEEAKKRVDIPVIASVNCVSSERWPSYAKQLQNSGADAIELNVYSMPADIETTSQQVEERYIEIVGGVRENTHLPIAMKIAPYFASLANMAHQLCEAGAGGLVLFNRFTDPDIDVKKLKPATTFQFTTANDYHNSLRWVALLFGKISCDLAATTGVHDAEGVAKMILAGASAVQVASVLYKKGVRTLSTLNEQFASWMKTHDFESLEDFKGQVSFKRTENPDLYLRHQFMQKIRGVE